MADALRISPDENARCLRDQGLLDSHAHVHLCFVAIRKGCLYVGSWQSLILGPYFGKIYGWAHQAPMG